jgi:hypothetical protein
LRELTNKFIINKNNGIKYDEPDLKVLHKIIDDSNDILKYVKNNLI